MIFRVVSVLWCNCHVKVPACAGRQPAAERHFCGGLGALLLGLVIGLGPGIGLVQADSDTRDRIRMAVELHLQEQFGPPGDNLRYDIGQLDPRLNLAACARPLQVSFPPGVRQSGYSSVAVQCPADETWKIHVPVTIRRFADVLVAVRHLPRGHRLGASDLRAERREISRLTRGYYAQTEKITGRQLKRAVRQGRVVQPASIASPRLVQRGDEITIIADTGNLVIHAKGKALMDGQEGDRIRVRNLRSREELQAIVIGPRQVKVTI